MTHSKYGEPWEAYKTVEFEGDKFYVTLPKDDTGFRAIICEMPLANKFSKERATRIVECVNACAGIADPSVIPELVEGLEALIDKFVGYSLISTGVMSLKNLKEVKPEHDELRNSLNDARALLSKIKGGTDGHP